MRTTRWRSNGTAALPAMIRFLEFQIGDAALVNAGIERGGDALHDRGLVFPDGAGQARPARAGARGRASGAEVQAARVADAASQRSRRS